MNARLDFLAAHPANGQEGPIISSAIQNLLEVKMLVFISSSLNSLKKKQIKNIGFISF